MSRLKLLIIGLDSVPPSTAFGSLEQRMPFLSSLREDGLSGPLRSTDPPITIPAWVTMTSGRSPGDLGIYGFRKRVANSYSLRLTTVEDLKYPRLWDLASMGGMTSAVVSVPLTFPVSTDPKTFMTGCFLTPSADSRWASSNSLKAQLTRLFGPYITDVEGFRGASPGQVVRNCTAITNQHFDIFRHLLETRSPHFGMIVDLGPDRLHHSVGRGALAEHPRYHEDPKLQDTVAKYYGLLDSQIERTVSMAGEDTVVMVVSDHGVRPLEGAVCINEWLIGNGYLKVNNYPDQPTPLSRCEVDWARTTAWAEGGYHGRIFINRCDRDPHGVVTPEQYDNVVAQLSDKLQSLTGKRGRPTVIHAASDLYPDGEGTPPDLTVYFGGLSLRCAGTLGHGCTYIPGNDTGPDDVNHALNGILALKAPGSKASRGTGNYQISDVFATSIAALGLAPPKGTKGRCLL